MTAFADNSTAVHPVPLEPVLSGVTPASPFCNIARHLPRMAALVPGQNAVIVTARRDKYGKAIYESLNFAEMEALSNRYASGLAAYGFTRGQRVLMMVRPGFDFIAITFALFKLGAVPVLIDPGMGIVRMLGCIRSVDVQGLIGILPAQVMRVLRPGAFGKATHWVTVGRRFGWGGPTLKDVAERGSERFELVETRADEMAAILFTSGSTGPAKGVVYEHGMFDAQVRMIQSQYEIMPGEVDLPALPVFALFSTAMGMTCVIPDMNPSRPATVNPAHIVEAIQDHHVTSTFGSPAIWKRVVPYCQQRDIKLTSLMRVLVAGCAVPPKLIAQLRELLAVDADVHTPYGATEALPICSISGEELFSRGTGLQPVNRAAGFGAVGPAFQPVMARGMAKRSEPCERSAAMQVESERAAKSSTYGADLQLVKEAPPCGATCLADAAALGHGTCVGKPLPGIEIRIINITDGPIPSWSDDLLVPDGDYGEIVTSGPVATKAYFNHARADALSKIRDSDITWHRMGDIGYRDAEGRIWFCGRKSQRIQKPSATLFPDQWEAVFDQHCGVVQTALVGVGPPGRQKAIVVIVPKTGRRPRRGEEFDLFLEEFFSYEILQTLPNPSGAFQFLFRKSLPVDVRHNAKINREALSQWAGKRIR